MHHISQCDVTCRQMCRDLEHRLGDTKNTRTFHIKLARVHNRETSIKCVQKVTTLLVGSREHVKESQARYFLHTFWQFSWLYVLSTFVVHTGM